MKKSTICKQCQSTDLYHGSFCRPCWREQEHKKRYGNDSVYRPRNPYMKPSDQCPSCKRTIASVGRHRKMALCIKCGNRKHRDYQRQWRIANAKTLPPKKKSEAIVIPKQKKIVETGIIIVPGEVKITRLPSAAPNFRDYAAGPDLQYYY